MSHDPFLPLHPYLPRGASGSPAKSSATASIGDRNSSSPTLSGDFSIDALVSNRRRILQVKFEVFAALIKKRLRVRDLNLEDLLEDEMKLHNLRVGGPTYILSQHGRYQVSPLPLEQAILKVAEERREEHRGCWRDLIPVIRDLLSTWEALEQAQARAMFLKSYPSDPQAEENNRSGGERHQ